MGKEEQRSCNLSQFEKRIYCAKKRIDKGCLKPWFLGHRCPYLQWTKDDVQKEARKGVKTIKSWSSFTEEAIEYANKFRPEMSLVHGDTVVKSAKRKVKAAAT